MVVVLIKIIPKSSTCRSYIVPCQIEFMLESPQNLFLTFEFASLYLQKNLKSITFLSVLLISGLMKIYKNTYKKYDTDINTLHGSAGIMTV